jgi:hypothetical protein
MANKLLAVKLLPHTHSLMSLSRLSGIKLVVFWDRDHICRPTDIITARPEVYYEA